MKTVIAAVSGLATVGFLWIFFRPPFGKNIVHLNTNRRVVALTYDDGPCPPILISCLMFSLNTMSKLLSLWSEIILKDTLIPYAALSLKDTKSVSFLQSSCARFAAALLCPAGN